MDRRHRTFRLVEGRSGFPFARSRFSVGSRAAAWASRLAGLRMEGRRRLVGPDVRGGPLGGPVEDRSQAALLGRRQPNVHAADLGKEDRRSAAWKALKRREAVLA